jgi:hypothetical protein
MAEATVGAAAAIGVGPFLTLRAAREVLVQRGMTKSAIGADRSNWGDHLHVPNRALHEARHSRDKVSQGYNKLVAYVQVWGGG